MRPVAIVGTNKLTRPLIDWELNADYWLFNEVGGLPWPKRVDGILQMHVPALWRNKNNVNHKEHYAWLQQPHPFPIWMHDVFPDVPASVKYPKDEIVEEFLLDKLTDDQGNRIEFFTSTPAYAMALAIYQKRNPIYLFGIEMGSDTEFFRQRAGFYFWCGLAIGRGLKIIKHSKSLLFSEPIYGYKGEIMIDRQEFELSYNHYAELEAKTKAEMFEAKGGAQKLLEAMFVAANQEDAMKIAKIWVDANNQTLDAAYKYGQITGAMQENSRYMKECDDKIASAGGERALEMMMKNEKVEEKIEA